MKKKNKQCDKTGAAVRQRLFVKRCITLILCVSVLCTTLTGCDREEAIPKLMEPVAIGSNYRPVAYGDVGDLLVAQGMVVPKNYCHFYNTNSNIDTILVDIGEFVEKGQVLAMADIEQAKSERDGLKEQMDGLRREREIKASIFEQNQKMYTLQKKEAGKKGEKEKAKEFEVSLNTLEENNRYDKLLFSYQTGKLEEQIKSLDEVIKEGTVRARHAGYVTYIKDITASNMVQPLENIVIVSDYKDVYVELSDITVDLEQYTKCEYIYTLINGKRYTISDMVYTVQELAKAKAMQQYPKLAYRLPEGVKQEVGARIPVCFCRQDKSHVLKVGRDSLYQEGDRYFVYVKTDESDMERRDVKLGEMDTNYAEVLSGLSEGELVYYKSSAVLPAGAKEYKIELSDYSQPVVLTSGFRTADEREYPIYARQEGVVTSVKVQETAQVKKGDLLAVVRVGEGASALKAAENEIKQLDAEHRDSTEEYRQKKKDLLKRLKEAKNAVSDEETDGLKSHEMLYGNTGLSSSGEEITGRKSIDEIAEKQSGEASSQEQDNKEIPDSNSVENTEQNNTEKKTEGEDTAQGKGMEDTTETQKREEEPTKGGQDTVKTSEDGSSQSPEKGQETPDEDNESLEVLTCQLAILQLEEKMEQESYATKTKLAQKNYDELAKQYNGDGTMNLYADRDGMIRSIVIKEGVRMKEGSLIYTISQPVTEKYNIMIKSENQNAKPAGLNEKVDFISSDQQGLQDGSDADVVASGHCVGIQSDASAFFIQTVDGQTYITKCGDTSKDSFFAVMDDKAAYGSKDITGIRYENNRMENVVTLSAGMVYEETDKEYNTTKYYVWQMIDQKAVKQFVVPGISDAGNVVILSGLSKGDIILKE